MRVCLWLIVCLPLAAGCEDPYSANVPADNNAPAADTAASSPSEMSGKEPGRARAEPDSDTAQPVADAPGAGAEAPGQYEREVAEVGVGKKGRNYGGGVITEPIRQNFRLRQRIVFMKIDQDLRVFEAAHERLPSSHEEFMEEIIKASDIPLPELPEGERFVWDPDRGELMVERPRSGP